GTGAGGGSTDGGSGSGITGGGGGSLRGGSGSAGVSNRGAALTATRKPTRGLFVGERFTIGASLDAPLLDEFLEPIQVALDAAGHEAQLVADGLGEAFGDVAHLQADARATFGGLEADDAGVLGAISGVPDDALIRDLLADFGFPLFLVAADFGLEVEATVIELAYFVHAFHEAGEFFELRPLVVGSAYRDIDDNRLFDLSHWASPLCRGGLEGRGGTDAGDSTTRELVWRKRC